MIDVGLLEEFEERSIRILELGGREVGIVRWNDGEVYALRNWCPHQAGPLCEGRLGPRLTCGDRSPGALEVELERPVIACAWHHWEFDVRTGESLWDPGFRAKTYPAKVVDGRVLVGIERMSKSKDRCSS